MQSSKFHENRPTTLPVRETSQGSKGRQTDFSAAYATMKRINSKHILTQDITHNRVDQKYDKIDQNVTELLSQYNKDKSEHTIRMTERVGTEMDEMNKTAERPPLNI